MEYISAALRLRFREFCVSISLSQIDSIFHGAGFIPATKIDSTIPINGERRTRVEEYYATIDWSSISDTRRFLKVISLLLSQAYLFEESKEELRCFCREEGLVVKGNSVYFNDALGIDWFLSSDAGFDRALFAKHCERIQQAVHSDPETAIGASKELVEAVSKYVLQQRGRSIGILDFPKLVKTAISELGLSVEDIPQSTKGASATKRILAAFNQIVSGMAELRNLYGTGHGHIHSSGPIKPRHAKLTVGAAITLATFLLETMEERGDAS